MSDIIINPKDSHGFHITKYDYVHKVRRTLCNVDKVEDGNVYTYCRNAWGQWPTETFTVAEFERCYERYEGGN